MCVVVLGVWLTQCFCFVPQLSGQLVHQQSQLCLEAVKEEGLPQSSPKNVSTHTGGLFLRPCNHHPRQQWHFEQLVAPKGAWQREHRGIIVGSAWCKSVDSIHRSIKSWKGVEKYTELTFFRSTFPLSSICSCFKDCKYNYRLSRKDKIWLCWNKVFI